MRNYDSMKWEKHGCRCVCLLISFDDSHLYSGDLSEDTDCMDDASLKNLHTQNQ